MRRVSDWVQRLREGRVGFRMDELMSGTHRFVDGAGPAGELPFSFAISWGPDRMDGYLNPFSEGFLVNRLQGSIDVGGLCEDAPCTGSLDLRYFQDAKIRYTIDFAGPDGRGYRYVGEKRDIRPWNLHRTHTTCYGKVTERDGGRLISESVVYFALDQMLPFVRSFRLA